MLSCPNHHHHLLSLHFQFHRHHHHHRNPNSATIISSSFNPQKTAENPTTTHEPILRTHNFKTSTLLHNHDHDHQLNPNPQPPPNHQKDQPQLQDFLKYLEISHFKHKKIPKFPGSISMPPNQSPLQTLFENTDVDEEEMEEKVMRAIEIRRKVTAEIFKECMKRGKFGITYSSNLVDRLDSFIDFVMIEAAALKRLPEFEDSSFNVRAKTVIEDLNIVPLVRWLKHNGLSYPKIAKLICLSKGDVNSIRRRADWLKSIHVRGEFIGVVLTKSGDNILDRSEEELDEIVEYLESNGVRRDWMGYVMRNCPQLLCSSIEEVKARAKFFLDMGINQKDFGTMVFDCPRALGYFTLEEMNQKVNYLKEFGLSNEEVGRLLAFKPQLMSCSIEERWKPLVKYLYYLGVTRDGMRRMLTIKPMVFCVDLQKTIVPKVRFFQDIGIRDDAIGNMLVKFPPLLTYSLYKKIRPVVIFLLTRAGVNERDIAKVIASGPELLGCSIVHKLDINVKYFLSLGIRVRQLGEMTTDFPMLLRYNIELLRPKYRYLRRTMVRPLQEVIEFPRFFSYSLEGRIIPRHKVMIENRVNFKLRYMLASSDEEFQKKVEAAVERRKRFENGIEDDTLQDFGVHDYASEEQEATDLPATDDEMDPAPETNSSLLMTQLDCTKTGIL